MHALIGTCQTAKCQYADFFSVPNGPVMVCGWYQIAEYLFAYTSDSDSTKLLST